MAQPIDDRPEPADLSHHLSFTVRNREESNIKRFYKYFQIPGIRNVAGGMPNHHLFPFETLGARVAHPGRFEPTPNDPVGDPSGAAAAAAAARSEDRATSDIVVPHEAAAGTDLLREIDVKTALQYGQAQGYPPLYAALRRFTRAHLHPNVPYKGGPEIVLSCGNTDGMAKTIEALVNPWIEGRDPVSMREGILCEEFCYPLALMTVRPRKLNIVPVRLDNEGIVADGPSGLRDVLENWDYSRGKRPHLLYTVTVGHNPTGGTLSLERRKALYEVCIDYDVIIIEDDPYWYLQFPTAYKHGAVAKESAPGARNYNTPKSSGYDFLDSLIPSFLSIDYEGRVVRLDTFSKTIAPGCRLGWVTAQPKIAERILRIAESSTQQPSGFVQSLVAQLILGPEGVIEDKVNGLDLFSAFRSKPTPQPGWKMDGWVRWLEGLRGRYERRMNAMCEELDEGKYLVQSGPRLHLNGTRDSDSSWALINRKEMYSFNWPHGGMFVWIRVHPETHPLSGKVPDDVLVQALWEHLTTKPYLVLASPGNIFGAVPEIVKTRSFRYFRLCFAAVDEDAVRECGKQFAKGCKSFWRKKEIDEIEELASKAESLDLSGEKSIEMMSLVGGC